ncbi:MAG: hypothetical protein AAF570_15020, partial [Bacteroidota bacterium]
AMVGEDREKYTMFRMMIFDKSIKTADRFGDWLFKTFEKLLRKRKGFSSKATLSGRIRHNFHDLPLDKQNELLWRETDFIDLFNETISWPATNTFRKRLDKFLAKNHAGRTTVYEDAMTNFKAAQEKFLAESLDMTSFVRLHNAGLLDASLGQKALRQIARKEHEKTLKYVQKQVKKFGPQYKLPYDEEIALRFMRGLHAPKRAPDKQFVQSAQLNEVQRRQVFLHMMHNPDDTFADAAKIAKKPKHKFDPSLQSISKVVNRDWGQELNQLIQGLQQDGAVKALDVIRWIRSANSFKKTGPEVYLQRLVRNFSDTPNQKKLFRELLEEVHLAKEVEGADRLVKGLATAMGGETTVQGSLNLLVSFNRRFGAAVKGKKAKELLGKFEIEKTDVQTLKFDKGTAQEMTYKIKRKMDFVGEKKIYVEAKDWNIEAGNTGIKKYSQIRPFDPKTAKVSKDGTISLSEFEKDFIMQYHKGRFKNFEFAITRNMDTQDNVKLVKWYKGKLSPRKKAKFEQKLRKRFEARFLKQLHTAFKKENGFLHYWMRKNNIDPASAWADFKTAFQNGMIKYH